MNERIEIDYFKLKPCDVVITGGIGLFGYGIRLVTGGWKNRRKRNEIATHVGIIVEFHGQLFIAEMLGDGLQINPLSRYTTKKNRFILDVVRLRNMTAGQKRDIQHRIALDRRYGLEYDWRGVFSFLNRKVKHSEKKYFCSEYVSFLLHEYAGAILSRKPNMIAPTDFQIGKDEIESISPVRGLRQVDGWKK